MGGGAVSYGKDVLIIPELQREFVWKPVQTT